MPQVSVTISDDTEKLCRELAEDNGESLSGLLSEFVRRGAYQEAENRNKVNVYRKMRSKEN